MLLLESEDSGGKKVVVALGDKEAGLVPGDRLHGENVLVHVHTAKSENTQRQITVIFKTIYRNIFSNVFKQAAANA